MRALSRPGKVRFVQKRYLYAKCRRIAVRPRSKKAIVATKRIWLFVITNSGCVQFLFLKIVKGIHRMAKHESLIKNHIRIDKNRRAESG
jgi:hypothetical protein